MTREPIVETTMSGENYMHRALWSVVLRAAENAEARPQGSLWDHLTVMVFAFHAFEAYLNFLGNRLDPALWKKEKDDRAIRSFAGKRSMVYRLVGLVEPDASAAPYRTVEQLKTLRDLISHGKIEVHAPEPKTTVGHEQVPFPWMPHIFDQRVAPEAATRAREDVHAIARELHEAARPHVRTLDGFGDDPFEGLQSQSTHGQRLVGWHE